MYTLHMKKRELEQRLKALGWWFEYNGKKHDQWTNGIIGESIPRHTEIDEFLARKIIRVAKENPPVKK